MKKILWIIVLLITIIIIGVATYSKMPHYKKICSDYTKREECVKNSRCDWPGSSCAVPGKNCGFTYDPEKDRCLPKK
ncbi:MAG: hypothetical protein US30_C0001G0115 [Candidatus Moranbacteria bacterium GW2011_GWF2_36_839]|nr:MAG: hypothetical protein US27_C0001G0115 [Candidatus Moranbacteria bacterium GW2011_GWF1_36_78]KKQ17781.1 MAG: hypothetical protein US30_C0001G0115 [Candidatus Moranbacteria bacterium GW2011_GWF2_36_839]HAT73483.1 hypothetical protein [Candidatus Moranbacteria bacterium]HBY10845.1 hypothetical protein [Candidatus Moranbacteria bacterium]